MNAQTLIENKYELTSKSTLNTKISFNVNDMNQEYCK